MQDKFDNIRPFYDSEIQDIFNKMISVDDLMRGALVVVPESLIDDFKQNHKNISDIETFQARYMVPMLQHLLRRKNTKLTFSGENNISVPTIFISNHRDIILDPSFLQLILKTNNHNTSEIAIGSNLGIKEWILNFMKLNRSFIVLRNLPRGSQMTALVELSEYINHTILNVGRSIWIAHREGRAKDSDDRTQVSLLKMLALGGSGSFIDNLKNLNLSPVSISYEYDACDYLKAKEMQQKRDDANFKKNDKDDLISMKTGIFGYASEIHYSFMPSINDTLDNIAKLNLPRQEEAVRVAQLIDRRIHQGYKIYKTNYIAYDMQYGENLFEKFYNSEEKINFANYISSQVSKIDLPCVDEEFCRNKIIEMYANPLKNQVVANS